MGEDGSKPQKVHRKRGSRRDGGVRETRVGTHEKEGKKSVTASEKRKGGENGKLRERLVKQVCHRWRNKQRECDVKSSRVMERMGDTDTRSGENNKNAHQ